MPYVDLAQNIQTQKNYWDMAKGIFNTPAPDPVANFAKMFLPFVSQGSGETPWISPETTMDIMAFLPVLGLTRHQFLRQAYNLGIKDISKTERNTFVKGIYKVPESHIKGIRKLRFYTPGEEESKLGAMGSYYPESRSIGVSRFMPPRYHPNTIFHEIAHYIYPKVSREDRTVLRTIVEQMWPKHKQKSLARNIGTDFASSNIPEEVFSQAYAEYRMGSDYFYKFPPKVRDLVKKYAME